MDYDDMKIKAPGYPAAVRVGIWWRRRWHFRLASGEWRYPLLLPPTSDNREVGLVITVSHVSAAEVVVDIYSSSEVVGVEELVYLSVFAAWLGYRYSHENVLIENLETHPLQSMSKLSPELTDYLERNGY
jgi:hypothetical protein